MAVRAIRDDLRRDEARAILARRKAEKLPRSNGRLATDHVDVKLSEIDALLARPVLEEREWCWLERKRAGLRQKDVAEQLGVSRLWVSRMESGLAPCDRLAAFWEA